MRSQEQASDFSVNNLVHIDNANVIDFLSSAASVLTKENLIFSRDSENFRLAISGQAGKDTAGFMLSELIKNGDRLTNCVMNLLGTEGFYASLYSQNLSSQINMLVSEFSEIGTDLISSAKLYFNRKIVFDKSSKLSDVCLASSYFESMIANLQESISTIEMGSRKTLYAVPLTEKFRSIQKQVSEITGSDLYSDAEFPVSDFKNKCSNLFILFYELISDLTNATAAIRTSDENLKNQLLLSQQILLAKLKEIEALNLNSNTGMSAFDLQRNAILARFGEALELVRVFGTKLHMYVKQLSHSSSEFELYEKQKRLIKLSLLEKNISPSDANTACEALGNYLTNNKVSFNKLIDAELKKIHPALSNISAEVINAAFVEIEFGHTEQKTGIYSSLSELSAKFTKAATTAISLFALAGLMLGCGVKGDPSSIAEAVRPDIPSFKHPLEAPSAQKQDLETDDKSSINKP